MRLRRVPSAFLASTFALVVLPAVALGLTLPPEDPVGEHADLDAHLAGFESRARSNPLYDLPAVAPDVRYHRVEPGESLATIAALHGWSGIDDWRLLFDANPDIEHPDLLEPGTRVRIPHRGEQLERRELPAPVVPAVRGRGGAAGGDVWWRLALCESGGQNRVSANGRYFGFFQFMPATWQSVGGTGLPTDHGYAEQVARAQILQRRAGWGQWPACARALGLR